jgi:peptidoglycan-associated lipoprotein
MNNVKPLLRGLIIPASLLLGACCCDKDVVVPPPPPPPPPVVAPIGDIYFDYDKSDIGMTAKDQLGTNAAWMSANPAAKLVVEGHCDERGTSEYNMALGERRANTAKDYLVGLGVDTARLRTVSYGEERPLDPGHDEAAWAKNRRVHFAAE